MRNPVLLDSAAKTLKFIFNFASTAQIPMKKVGVDVSPCGNPPNETRIVISGLTSDVMTESLFEDAISSILKTLADSEILEQSFQTPQVLHELKRALYGGDEPSSKFSSIFVNSDKAIEIHTEKKAEEIVALLSKDIPGYASSRANAAAVMALTN